MTGDLISSRAVLGEYFKRLEAENARSWVPSISNLFQDTRWTTEISMLGYSPQFRKWTGERMARDARQNNVTIINEDYEASLEFHRRDVTQDKTAQVMARAGEFGMRGSQHWGKLVTAAIVAGESTACYDGQYFFDTDHSEGSSGTQDNDLTENATNHLAPTDVEMETAIMACIQAILGFVDEEGEPINEGASAFTVMVPAGLWARAKAVIGGDIIQGASGTKTSIVARLDDFIINLRANPRLDGQSGWFESGVSSKLAVFRTDSPTKALIRIQDMPVNSPGVRMTVLAEGSEYAKLKNRYLFGAEATRGVGYGYWQHACLYTLT